MTSVFSATPPADQPPASIDVPPAARDHADRWDWLRATAFFCVAVFLLNAIAAVLRGWTLFGWVIIPDLRLFLMQNGQILAIGDLVLPAALLIAGSALSDHTFWGVTGRERLWSVGRIVLALGIVAAVVGLALTFGNSIYQALLPPPFARIRAPLWLLNGTEHGLVFGVALPFVFRRLSQRTGRAWLVGLLGAMLLAGGMLGLYSHLATPLRWVTNAWMKHLPIEDPVIYDIPIHDLQEIRCFPGSITGCFGPQAQTWVVAGILPIVVALLLGALIGAPLAYPYGTREARAPEAAERAAHPQQAQGEGRLRWALGIGAGSLLVGLVAMGTRLYAIYKLMLPRDNYLNIPPFIDLAIVFGTLAIVQLVPFGILALLGAIRLMRLPRGGRPAAWSVGVLALVCVLGLLPTLIPAVFPFPTGTVDTDDAWAFGLPLGEVSIAFAASLGALLALCWWPATASSMRRTLMVTLAGWLGFMLPILLLAGYIAHQIAAYSSVSTYCRSLSCGAFTFEFTKLAIQVGLIAAFVGLPLTLVGVWMGSWLLERGTRSRARDAVA